MDIKKIEELLESVKKGSVSTEAALERLKSLPYEDIGFAKIDSHRPLRLGAAEVIFCRGKSVRQITEIIKAMSAGHDLIFATRASEEIFRAVSAIRKDTEFFPDSGALICGKIPEPRYPGPVLVVSAGTSDIPVAEEASLTARVMGSRVETIYDAGVAGIHRILNNLEPLRKASVIIAVAGMDGALPSIIGGLAGCPVIAVPTSVGYGANLAGIAPLLTMLNSCAPGITVVNIDNGFGAGYAASLINSGRNR